MINYRKLVETLDWIKHPAEYDKGEPHAVRLFSLTILLINL